MNVKEIKSPSKTSTATSSSSVRASSKIDEDKEFAKTMDEVKNSTDTKEKTIEETKSIQQKQSSDSENSDNSQKGEDEKKLDASQIQAIQNQAMFNQNQFSFDISGDGSFSDIFSSKGAFKIDMKNLSDDDISFLNTVIKEPQQVLNNINNQKFGMESLTSAVTKEVSAASKSDFSNDLFNIIQKSYNAQKPVRVSVDENSSVILKIDMNGKVSAQFISNDMAVAQALKANLPSLKEKFDEENLPYTSLSYKDQSDQQKNNRNNNNQGEK